MRRSSLRGFDFTALFLYLIIAIFGILNIYSVDEPSGRKEAMWLIVSLVVGLSTFIFRAKFFENFAGIFYIIGLFLLGGVLVVGSEVGGAKAWYKLGPVSVQPVEFAKITIALMLANFINSPSFDIKNKQSLFWSFLILAIPGVLVMLQPDAGSLLVFTAFVIALYREGLSGWFFIAGFYVVIIFLTSIRIEPYKVIIGVVLMVALVIFYYRRIIQWSTGLIFFVGLFVALSAGLSLGSDKVFSKLANHQQARIHVLFDGEGKYRDGAGYNLLFAKTAIGSGGFWGKGYREGSVTAGKFVPEQKTDYIFTAVGEEWGTIGSVGLILLYVCLMYRIYILAEQQKSTFSRVIGYIFASVLLMHFIINIGMVIGLFPTVGIPLPFFSYGGSSLLGFTLFFFIFLRLNYADKNSMV